MQRDQLQEWREQVGRRLINLDFKPLSDGPVNIAVTPVLDASGVRIARTSFSAGTSYRDSQMVKDAGDEVTFPVALTPVVVTIRGRSIRLGRGEATLIPLAEPAAVGASAAFSAIGLMLPRKELEQRGAALATSVGTPLRGSSDPLSLLRGYLTTVQRHDLRGDVAMLARGHVLDLVALACSRHSNVGESKSGEVFAARFAIARDFIERNFADPSLTLAATAKAQRVSPRYLQLTFEAMGSSFTGILTEIRLGHAMRLLSQKGGGGPKVSEVAGACGYGDISNFHRAFKARFGITPGEARAHGQSSKS